MAQSKCKKIMDMLDRKVLDIKFTPEQVALVKDLVLTSELQPLDGVENIDGLVKTLGKKYYPYCKNSISLPVVLNILYMIFTEKSCSVHYLISVAADKAKEMSEVWGNKLPIEFFLSETLECVEQASVKMNVFAEKEDEESMYTLREALEGIVGRPLEFPTEVNPLVAVPDSSYYLLYVDNSRWLAVVSSDIAGVITQFANPVTKTAKGLMQGETLLRTLNGRNGIVTDDYVIL